MRFSIILDNTKRYTVYQKHHIINSITRIRVKTKKETINYKGVTLNKHEVEELNMLCGIAYLESQ
jgi:hypothetical protein